MPFTAMEDKVILKVAESKETTVGGLIIPDSASEMPDQGVVVAVGPGRTSFNGTIIPTGISVGDKVLFNKRAAQAIDIDGEEYLVFLAEHILAIVTD
jgi:chaperonin GroES